MRLLHTGRLEYKWFSDPLTVDYAILSHVWSQTGEQSYHDVLLLLERSESEVSNDIPEHISEKIAQFRACALADGYDWIWIDSCCIDKSSSAELSEAINSMYKWYASTSQCYAYLHDVDDADDPRERRSEFRASKWFTRGWTLQELIAPSTVTFLTKNWRPIGTKHTLAGVVREITGIDVGILKGTESLEVVSVARRMSWAARRKTTRVEDEAYSLMGMFDIHMPAIYGEGRRAFLRLQEEILKQYPDDTLFAWGDALSLITSETIKLLTHSDNPPDYHGQLFAPSPASFESAGELWPISQETLMQRLGRHDPAYYPPPTYSVTRYGVQAELPILSFPRTYSFSKNGLKLGFLLCEDSAENLFALVLRPASIYTQYQPSRPGPQDPYLVGTRAHSSSGAEFTDNYRLVTLSGPLLQHLMSLWCLSVTLEITHMPRGGPLVRLNPRWNVQTHPHAHPGKCTIFMPSWRTTELAAHGIAVRKLVMDRPSTSKSAWCPRRHIFILSHQTGAVRIVVGFCEHCSSADIVDRQVGSLRLQVQSCSSKVIPPTTPANLWFGDHPVSARGLDHVHQWP
ncbi:heterokaryon incompatibility protein-domain-containing protein, partial [Earliella scabrosa]